jgi:hypothetical protein
LLVHLEGVVSLAEPLLPAVDPEEGGGEIFHVLQVVLLVAPLWGERERREERGGREGREREERGWGEKAGGRGGKGSVR